MTRIDDFVRLNVGQFDKPGYFTGAFPLFPFFPFSFNGFLRSGSSLRWQWRRICCTVQKLDEHVILTKKRTEKKRKEQQEKNTTDIFLRYAIFASPLIAGNDLRNMTAETIELLTNKNVISINQVRALNKHGSLCFPFLVFPFPSLPFPSLAVVSLLTIILRQQGSCWYGWIRSIERHQIWRQHLCKEASGVFLCCCASESKVNHNNIFLLHTLAKKKSFSSSTSAQSITLEWSYLQIAANTSLTVVDCWTSQNLGVFENSFEMKVDSYDCGLIRLTPM